MRCLPRFARVGEGHGRRRRIESHATLLEAQRRAELHREPGAGIVGWHETGRDERLQAQERQHYGCQPDATSPMLEERQTHGRSIVDAVRCTLRLPDHCSSSWPVFSERVT